MSDRRALMGALVGSANIPWREWTATQTTTTIPPCLTQLFGTRVADHTYVAVLKDKAVSQFANNQAVLLGVAGTGSNAAYIRYRNGAYTQGAGSGNYDAVIQTGDKYWIADIDVSD